MHYIVHCISADVKLAEPSEFLVLFDEFPVGDQVLSQEQREQRREHALPVDLIPEDFGGVGPV